MQEQQQIPVLVRAIRHNPPLADAIVNTPQTLVEQGFTPRVLDIVSRLIPHLSLTEKPKENPVSLSWWGYY